MQTERLTASESLMLDIIRVAAAAVVAFGHLTQSHFSTGWPDLTRYASGAVAVFFVLSGFVIRHVTTRRAGTFNGYVGDRLSRIYSVAIPALFFTLVADSISRRVNPVFYASWASDYVHPIWRIVQNLAFCGQLWNRIVEPLSNSPYWSISYEMAYYLGYGCFFYLASKSRWLFIVALGLACGYRVLLLCPLWIAGCIIHDLYQRWNAAGTTSANLNRIFAALVLLGVVAISIHRLHLSFAGTAAINRHLLFLHGGRLGSVDYIFAVVWTFLFMRLLLAARHLTFDTTSPIVRRVRFISEGTYPIYLFHFPLYVLIAACIPYNHASSTQKLVLFLGVLTLGIVVGHPCNILKKWLRSLAFHPASPGKPEPAPAIASSEGASS